MTEVLVPIATCIMGQLQPFDHNTGDWADFRPRPNNIYFIANNIIDVELQCAILLKYLYNEPWQH